MSIDQSPPGRPVPMLSAGQVYLRPAEREDIPLFVRWLSDARTNRHLLMRSPISRAMEERWFDELLEHHGRDRWHYVVCRHDDDRPVGTLDLHEIDGINGGAGLGIVIGDPADTGHGYGSDAMTALITFGFEQLRLRRIWLDVHDDNPRARALYVRLGFVLEATFRHGVFRGGRFIDVHRMAILSDEWAARIGVSSPGEARAD